MDSAVNESKISLRAKIIDYLADPEHPFVKRHDLIHNVLGYKDRKDFYRDLGGPASLLTEIEIEALNERRRRCAEVSIKVDAHLVKMALTSKNPQWTKLYYERFEGWTPKQLIEHSGPGGLPLRVAVVDFSQVKLGDDEREVIDAEVREPLSIDYSSNTGDNEDDDTESEADEEE